MGNLTIVRKLYVAVAITAACLVGLGLYARVTTSEMKAALRELRTYPALLSLLNDRTIDHYKWAEALGVGTLLLGKDFTGQLDPTKCQFGKWYYATTPPKELEETFRKVEAPHRRLHASAEKALAALKAGNADAARTVYQEQTVPALTETQQALAEMRSSVQRIIERMIIATEAGQEAIGRWSLVVYAIVVLGLLAGAVFFLARPLRRKLDALTRVLEAIAGGDLTRRARVDGHDECARMAADLNEATDGMRRALGEVQVSAIAVASASRQVSGAAKQLSAGAQEQAASLEQTAASLEEITGTVRQNADSARQASELASGSRDVADRAGQVVADAVHAMSDINRSSRKIADIITTIDEIAFQTNLLALNAAVEAARAGEQGRGFAVVATEVRNLAQRSATAAKEIKALIEDSVAKVEGGSELVNRSGGTFGEIVGSVKRVTDIIAEIAAASAEQTTGIDQVTRAVSQMDQVAQTNASQTEELSSTSQSLSAQADKLQVLVARFRLSEDGASSARAVVPDASVQNVTDAGRRPVPRPAPALAAAHAGDGDRAAGDGFEEF